MYIYICIVNPYIYIFHPYIYICIFHPYIYIYMIEWYIYIYIYTTPQCSQQHCYNTQDMEPAKMSIFVFWVVFFLLFYFWSAIALQCYIQVCRTTKRISCMYTYTLSLEPLFHTPHPSHPTRSSQSSPVLHSSFPVAILHKVRLSRWLSG